jgi:L-rhamnose-H+ transport protein
MMQSNPILGVGLHAIGGMSASSCYTPQAKLKNTLWSALAGTLWFVQFLFYGRNGIDPTWFF